MKQSALTGDTKTGASWILLAEFIADESHRCDAAAIKVTLSEANTNNLNKNCINANTLLLSVTPL